MVTDDDKNWIKEELAQGRHWFSEQLERLESNLLTEFHKWESPEAMRRHTRAAVTRVLDAPDT